jgi:ribosomal protein S1
MIKFKDIQVGDYLMADNDGDILQGEVTNLNGDEKQVCVDTGTQEFWFETNQLSPIPLDEQQLLNFRFHKEEQGDGMVKYMKGAFRILILSKGDFSKMEIWYRDERRHIMEPINVHQLQNHFHQMTKVPLNDEPFN